MRLDLPHDLPRKRTRERETEAPLPPSSIERHRESLQEQADHPHAMPVPRRSRESAGNEAAPLTQERPHIPHDPRLQREHIPPQAIGLSLRQEELKLLADVARFRVVSTGDLKRSVYQNRSGRLERDLAFLKEQGLAEVDRVRTRRDGRRGGTDSLEVVTLTRQGREIARLVAGLPQDQKLYSGMVKPREVQHDTQIYRAFEREAERIEAQGGTNLRVRLDFELKAQIQKAIYAQRKADPERDLTEIKREVAAKFDLPFVNDSIQIPDARIDYDLPRKDAQDVDQGSRTGHQDIEVLTAAYRPGHLRGKAQAGFRLYASGADRATLLSKIENEHHLLDKILEL